MKRKCAVKTAGSLLLAGALAFAPQGSFLGNMQGIKAVQAEETDDWAIYWYLCGSDLESNYGSATEDLSELMEAELPENVKVFSMFALGYPAETRPQQNRFEPERIHFIEK